MTTDHMKALVTAVPNTAAVQDVSIPEPGPREIRYVWVLTTSIAQ